MRHSLLLFTILMPLLIAAPVAAQAQETRPSGEKTPTRIETDSESHEIRFFIDGALAAVLKADGLHVRNSIGFGGTLTDYGAEGFSKFGAQDVKETGDAAE